MMKFKEQKNIKSAKIIKSLAKKFNRLNKYME